jgi:hypothetical protein
MKRRPVFASQPDGPKEIAFSLEPPDTRAVLDFLGFCTVKLTIDDSVDPPTLHVCVTGEDDRATILIDKVVELPPSDEEDEENQDDAEMDDDNA